MPETVKNADFALFSAATDRKHGKLWTACLRCKVELFSQVYRLLLFVRIFADFSS
jgi:hypothetical protein